MFTKELKKIKINDLKDIFHENLIAIEYTDNLYDENLHFFDLIIEDTYVKLYKKFKNKSEIINQTLLPEIFNINKVIKEWKIYTKDTKIEEEIEEFLIDEIKNKNLNLLILLKY